MEAMYSVWEASKFLQANMKVKTVNEWYGYLKNNPVRWREQDGYRVVCHVINGNLAYTKSSLRAFIKSHQKHSGV